MTLKPEDRALIERVLGHNPGRTLSLHDVGLIIQAARSGGDVSRGGEPVAWLCHDLILGDSHVITDRHRAEWRARRSDEWRVEPLYAAPPPALPDEVVRDAERYRFLRNANCERPEDGGIFIGITPQNVIVTGEDADREVDAAMLADRLPTTEGTSHDQ